jgi:hypothetical protein
MKVELELSSLSGIALTLRKPSVEPDPIEKLRVTLVFQTSADFSISKNGRFLSTNLDINLFSNASLPANC